MLHERQSEVTNHPELRAKILSALSESLAKMFGAETFVEARDRIKSAMQVEMDDDLADELAHHLIDWIEDAASILAIYVYPAAFTDVEIRDIVTLAMVHIPSHAVAAGRLAGFPPIDILSERSAAKLANDELEPDTIEDSQES